MSLESVNKVTDAYLAALEPARKLALPGGAKEDPVVVEGGKPVPGFKVRVYVCVCSPPSTWEMSRDSVGD